MIIHNVSIYCIIQYTNNAERRASRNMNHTPTRDYKNQVPTRTIAMNMDYVQYIQATWKKINPCNPSTPLPQLPPL